jgi:hypothetical protein
LSLKVDTKHCHDGETPNRYFSSRFTASGKSTNIHTAVGQDNIISTNNLLFDIITPGFVKLAMIYPEFAKTMAKLNDGTESA